MADVSLPKRDTSIRLARVLGLPVAFLLIFGLSMALSDTAQRCDTNLGRWNARIHSFLFFSCACKTPSLDFRDSCNSMYIPAL